MALSCRPLASLKVKVFFHLLAPLAGHVSFLQPEKLMFACAKVDAFVFRVALGVA